MAIKKQAITYFNFSGGLNTESSPLNTKPGDADDILNTELGLDGSITRRRGVDFIAEKDAGGFYETNIEDLTAVFGTYADAVPAATPFNARSSDGRLLRYTILIVSQTVYIYSYDVFSDLSEVSSPVQTIDISSGSNIKSNHYKTRFVVNANRIYLLNKFIEFSYLEFDTDTNSFTFNTSSIFVRNLYGNPDPDTHRNHHDKSYGCIKSHSSSSTTEPGIGIDWEDYWVLDGSSDPNYNDWNSNLQTEKSNIVSLNKKLFGLEDSNITKPRNYAATFSAGRLWLSGIEAAPNTVYFSQTIVEDKHHNRMYQFADPLNRYDSAVVDTDGGTVIITGAESIVALAPFTNGVLILATNGIWFISSIEGFKTTDFSVDKLSSEGIAGEDAYALVEDKVVYFGDAGIFIITVSEVSPLPSIQSIDTKIKTFYQGIPVAQKQSGKASYNRAEKKLYFFTNFESQEWITDQNPNKQNTHARDMLVFNTQLGAWYKHSLLDDLVGTAVSIGDVFNVLGGDVIPTQVVDESDVDIVDESDELVFATRSILADKSISTTLVLMKQNGDGVDFSFGQLVGSSLTDFSLNIIDETSYDSYITSSQQILGDVIHKKQVPYITTIFDRVESGTIDDETGEDITPGGCLMSISYDFAITTAAAKFGTPRQVYLPHRWTTSYFNGQDPGIEVVRNKHKVRGRGSAFQIKFANDEDKDFKLYGFQVELTASRRV